MDLLIVPLTVFFSDDFGLYIVMIAKEGFKALMLLGYWLQMTSNFLGNECQFNCILV